VPSHADLEPPPARRPRVKNVPTQAMDEDALGATFVRASGEQPRPGTQVYGTPPPPPVPGQSASIAYGLDASDDDGEEATTQRDPLLGQQLGEYVVRERIGVGGMGIVYRGEQPVIGKAVAIKVLRPDVVDKPVHMERLLAEARAVNAIRHRGIIDIFSFGQTPDGRQYFVMEFLEGLALDEHVAERGLLTPHEALGIFDEILAALAAAHQAGVIHRDLKPNNIFLVKQPGGGTYVKVLDFGLAKHDSARDEDRLRTQAGVIMGTPEYMAPEQIRCQPVSEKTDLYSFGILAFQMLTGELPFTAASPAEFLVRHLEYAPPSPLELQPDLSPELADWVLSMLAKDPDARPPMTEVRQTLRQLQRALARDATNVRGVVPPPARPAPAPRSLAQAVPPAVKSAPRGTPSAEAPPAAKAAPRGTPSVEAPPAAVPPPDVATTAMMDVVVPPRRQPGPIIAVAGVVVLLLGTGAFFALRRSPAPIPPVPPEAPAPVAQVAPEAPAPVAQVTPAPPAPAPVPPPEAPAPAAAPVAQANPEGPKDPPAAPETPGDTKPGDIVPASGEPAGQAVVVAKAERLETKLLGRIRRYERDFKRVFPPTRKDVPAGALDVLHRLRARVDDAKTLSDLKAVSTGLDGWNENYLKPYLAAPPSP
jgi:serine/threonine-protein kinase